MAFWLGMHWIECNVQCSVCRIKWDSRPSSGPTLGGTMETRMWIEEELKWTKSPEYVHRGSRPTLSSISARARTSIFTTVDFGHHGEFTHNFRDSPSVCHVSCYRRLSRNAMPHLSRKYDWKGKEGLSQSSNSIMTVEKFHLNTNPKNTECITHVCVIDITGSRSV